MEQEQQPYLHSISAYVDKIVDTIDDSSMQVLRTMKKEELPRLHHGWGMAIRNSFGLWKSDHPLTAKWHSGINNDIRDGVDYSVDHPDQISMKIMEGVWEKVNA